MIRTASMFVAARQVTPGAVSVVTMRSHRTWRRIRAAGLVLGALVVAAALAFGLLWALTPSVGDLQRRVADRLAAHGSADLGELPVPDRIGQAVVATEDSRFFSDHGVDPRGVVRGVLGGLGGDEDGGATLDQQLAKLLYTPERTGVGAKIEQVILGVKIDSTYSKQRILRAYLTSVYFGQGYYGVAAAARGYFDLAPGDLSWAQASLLAGVVQAPTAYDPLTHLDLAKQRQRDVLDRLVATGVLSGAQADATFAAPLHLRVPLRDDPSTDRGAPNTTGRHIPAAGR
ncbi:MAG: transglycosylase domain-containing protein [Actinomycetota bacterium]|nr:transglycosylase domain-containing protein [Actinomycetota bacterium]